MKKYIISCIVTMPLLFIVSILCYNEIIFDVNVVGHLKRASNANTVDLAQKELGIVLNYLTKNNLYEGSTAVFIKSSPECDIGFWYNNLLDAYNELADVTRQTSKLERTNILIKLRESLIDHGTSGDRIIVPPDIIMYPNIQLYYILLIFFSIITTICWFSCLISKLERLK